MTHSAISDIITVLARESNARFEEMTRAFDALERNPNDVPALIDLIGRFHCFAGLGGLDGFEIINVLGNRGEEECRRSLAAGNNPAPEQLRRWKSLMDVMRSEIEEARRAVAEASDSGQFDNDLQGTQVVQEDAESVARILSVEDDPYQAEYLRAVLESAGYEVHTCSDAQQFEPELDSFAPDLILMDILLPDASGYELARFARQHEEHQATPILFLTTEGELHTRIQSIRSGGDEHIVKPVSPSLLLAAVETRLERARQLRNSIDRDSLTGLLNRRAFLRRVQARIRRGGDGPASLVMLDVDHFKSLNDNFGHGFGDHVLFRLASFLRSHVRASDSVCRYGGEEFTMLVDDTTEEEAVNLVDRLREEFAAMSHAASKADLTFVTFSAGVAQLPDRVSAMPHVLEAADAALYRAKAEGRNRVCGATSVHREKISA